MANSKLPFQVLPGGTVTFLFTDIEGSTDLLDKLRDRYAPLLEKHREILSRVINKWNGYVVDSRGEEFFIAFPRASDAVAAAIEAQKELVSRSWPAGAEVKVRMGLHTGEPWVAEEGYVGIDVHRAARIGNVGHGGQVLLSETTTSLVRDELPAEVDLMDLGPHKLKDASRPESISQLIISGMISEFPPLKSQDALPVVIRRWRVNRPAILRQLIRAGIGCALAMTILSVMSIVQVRTGLPGEFGEASLGVPFSVWVTINVLLSLVWGGMLGLALGFMIALADTFWNSNPSIVRRSLMASPAGLIYSGFLISTAISSGSWTDQGPGIFIPAYVSYGLIMGASLSLVVPPLGEKSTMRHQLARSTWAFLIMAVAGALSVFLAYGTKIEETYFRLDLFIFLGAALIFPLSLAILLRNNSSQSEKTV